MGRIRLRLVDALITAPPAGARQAARAVRI